MIQRFTIALAVILLASCSEEKKELKPQLRPVKYQEVGYLGGDKTRTFSGTAQTEKIIGLSFRSSGVVTELDIKLGQKVRKNQLLAKLDNVQARLNYENAVAAKNSAESQMNTTKLALNRTRSLFEKGSASLSDFEAAKNSYKTANESFESAKRSVSIQQEQIKFGYIYAPEDGVIAAVNVEAGTNIGAGQNIATLNAGSDMEISLGVPESIINGIKNGNQVDISFASLPELEFKGKITEVAPSVDAGTATYPVRIMIMNPSEEIKSGMAANVTFNFGSSNNATNIIVVPANAVGEDSNGRFVFIVNDDKTNASVKKQRIEIGNLTTEGFEVKSGLSAGQKIATAGLQTLLDGQKVKL